MKKSKWRKNKIKNLKKFFSKIKKHKSKISTQWGIIILLAIIILGMIFWVSLLNRKLGIVTEGLANIAVQTQARQSVQQQNITEQDKRLENLEETQENKNASNAIIWQIYENDNYNFSIQYPSAWISINSIFDPETIVEFASKTRNDNSGLIHFAVTPYGDFEEASEENLIVNEGAKLIDDEEVLINGSPGLKAYYKTSEGDIFTHYFFMMDEEVIEISLNSADQGYNKTFEDMIVTLTISK